MPDPKTTDLVPESPKPHFVSSSNVFQTPFGVASVRESEITQAKDLAISI